MIDIQLEELFHLNPYCFTEEQRDETLLPIIRRQVTRALWNPHIRSMFDKLNIDPTHVTSLKEIPAVPVTMFKLFDLKTKPETEILKILHSSGTTAQIPSIITLDKLTMQLQTRALAQILSSYLGKQRRIFLVIDHEGINSPTHAFTARTAGVRGFSLYARKTLYLLKEVDGILTLNTEVLEELRSLEPNHLIYAFGFTYIIWSVFVQAMLKSGVTLRFQNLVLFHSGGWKKLTEQEVSKDVFSNCIAELFGMEPCNVIDFYGMAEQTGIIFPDCPQGNKHVPVFSKVIIRNIQTLEPCIVGEQGLIEMMSVLPQSYYGQAVLTEDIGQIIGMDGCPCGRRGLHFTFIKRVEQTEVRGCGDTFRVQQ